MLLHRSLRVCLVPQVIRADYEHRLMDLVLLGRLGVPVGTCECAIGMCVCVCVCVYSSFARFFLARMYSRCV